MFRALDPKGQAFLLDRYNKMEAAHTQRSQEIAPLRKATEKWTPYLAQIQAEPSQVFDKSDGVRVWVEDRHKRAEDEPPHGVGSGLRS